MMNQGHSHPSRSAILWAVLTLGTLPTAWVEGAPLPVGLLASETFVTNTIRVPYNEFGRDSALSGDRAVVSLYPGVDLYVRDAEGWRYQGRLLKGPRKGNYAGRVALDGDTLVLTDDPVNGAQRVQVWVPNGAPGLNAWQIYDFDGEADLAYTAPVTAPQHAQGATDGWRLRTHMRYLDDYESYDTALGVRYGNGTTTYEVSFQLNFQGQFLAVLPGATPQEHLLTTNLAEVSAYHTHVIEYDPTTQMATYLYDGAPIHTWAGQASSLDGVAFGHLSGLDYGAANFHEVTWETLGTSPAVVTYDAGEGGNPIQAPAPEDQGWAAVGGTGDYLAYGPQSPDPITTWSLQAEFAAADTTSSDFFGASLALHGDTLVVGAPFDTPNGTQSGSVHVFVRNGTNWSQQATLVPSLRGTYDVFGSSVAVHGDMALVGAPNRNFSASNPGRAFAFLRNGTNWQQFGTPLTAGDGVNNDSFGSSVALDGDLAVMGAPNDAHSGVNYAGSAYVFEKVGGAWSQLQKVVASPVNSAQYFGSSVDMSGTTLLVGAIYSATWHLFSLQGTVWSQTRSAELLNLDIYDPSLDSVDIDGERFMVSGSGLESEFGGTAEIFAPDFSDAEAVNEFVGSTLYYDEAQAMPGANPMGAAFRYRSLLYGQEGSAVRPRYELMQELWTDAERRTAMDAEQLLLRGLRLHPDDPGLGGRLLDIYYDRAVAERLLAGNLQDQAFKARFGGTLSPPPTGGGFHIDLEIPLYRELVATNRFVLDQYLSLLSLSAPVIESASGPPRWASQVLDVSSEWNSGSTDWAAVQTLGAPDTYPIYGDYSTAWASQTSSGQREYLVLGYDNPTRANQVDIYETLAPGGVDMVSVRNANDSSWNTVWTGTAQAAGSTARVFSVTFPRTAYPVDGVRLDIDSPAVPSWQEIDAVGLVDFVPVMEVVREDLGLDIFRNLVPGRGKMAATYTNAMGQSELVTTNHPVLFSGYRDMVLLFDLLREQARATAELGRLLAARHDPGDAEEVRDLISDTQRYLFLQGNLLLSLFPALPPPGDPSGLAEVIEGWKAGIESINNLEAGLSGNANILGFAPDFLMLIENLSLTTNTFDSFDVFKIWNDPATGDSPLKGALDDLTDARDLYAQYRGFEDQIREQYDQSTISYEFRLFEIVGARPGEPRYSNSPTNNAGSELDQQFRSIEAAHLRIKRNQVEISNLQKEVNIELAKAAGLSNVYVRYGDMRASIEETIGHINATQAAMNSLADAFSPENLAKAPLVIFGVVNAVVQAGGEELKGQLNGEKERLAGMEQAEVVGIESDARVKTLLLGMATLQVDSQEAGLQLRQEMARMTALYREKQELEARIAERNKDLASRYFADPIHRIVAETNLLSANLSFGQAQKWLFFMARALEYKWNLPFANFEYPSGSGRFWSEETLFKLRNAEELQAFYVAMVEFNRPINRGRFYSFDWFSVRDDFMKLPPSGGPYIDPVTGMEMDGISLFRTNLLRRLQTFQGGSQVVIEFSTVRQIPGGFFFVGPTFDNGGALLNKGRFLDKIEYLQIRLPGTHTLGRSQLAGNLTYGGTSFIRNFNVGHFDAERPDELVDEMTAYSTRYWFYDPSQGQMRWRFNENLTIDSVEMELSPDPRVPPSANIIEEFKERSVAATGWKLTIPLRLQGVEVLNIDELNDVEIYFYHYSAQRQ